MKKAAAAAAKVGAVLRMWVRGGAAELPRCVRRVRRDQHATTEKDFKFYRPLSQKSQF